MPFALNTRLHGDATQFPPMLLWLAWVQRADRFLARDAACLSGSLAQREADEHEVFRVEQALGIERDAMRLASNSVCAHDGRTRAQRDALRDEVHARFHEVQRVRTRPEGAYGGVRRPVTDPAKRDAALGARRFGVHGR